MTLPLTLTAGLLLYVTTLRWIFFSSGDGEKP